MLRKWSIFKTFGKEELESLESVHASLAGIQEKTTFLPGYGFKRSESIEVELEANVKIPWPAVDTGTSMSGLIGSALTLLAVVLIGLGLKRRRAVS